MPATRSPYALANTRDSTGAVAAYTLALQYDSTDGTILSNLAFEYLIMGRYREVDSVLGLFASRHVPFPTAQIRFTKFWNGHQYDSAEALAQIGVDSADALHAAGALTGMVNVVELRGRLHEAEG